MARRHAAAAPQGASRCIPTCRPDDRVFYFTTCGWMMWNWLVSASPRRDACCSTTARPSIPERQHPVRLCGGRALTQFGTSAKYIDACAKAGVKPPHHDLSTRAHDHLDRLAARAGRLRLRLSSTSSRTCTRLDLRRHRHRLLLRARQSDRPGLARRDPGARLGMAVEVWDDDGKPVTPSKGELVCTRRSRRCRSASGTTRRQEIPRRLFRALREHLAPRRFRRMDRAWRHDHPWPLRRHAQPRRRAHRHGRDLSPGRADARGGRGDRHRPGLGQRRARRPVRAPARGRDARRALSDKIKSRSAGATPRHVPAKIMQVADIPRTKSGKIVRARAVRYGAWAAGEEQGSAGQSGGAGVYARASRNCSRDRFATWHTTPCPPALGRGPFSAARAVPRWIPAQGRDDGLRRGTSKRHDHHARPTTASTLLAGVAEPAIAEAQGWIAGRTFPERQAADRCVPGGARLSAAGGADRSSGAHRLGADDIALHRHLRPAEAALVAGR